MSSKATRRRAKHRKGRGKSEFDLPPTPTSKKARGTTRMKELAKEDMSTNGNLIQRAKEMGTNDLKEVQGEGMGDKAERAITVACGKDKVRANRLIQVWRDYTSARRAYYKTLGVSEHAKTAKLEMMPDVMETRADDTPPDLRSEEERDKAARDRYEPYRRVFSSLPPSDILAINRAHLETVEFVQAGVITVSGMLFVDALDWFYRLLDKNN